MGEKGNLTLKRGKKNPQEDGEYHRRGGGGGKRKSQKVIGDSGTGNKKGG